MLILVTLCVLQGSAHAERIIKGGTEWGSVDGSLAEFVSHGYKLVYVAHIDRMITYYLQGTSDLVRCYQEISSATGTSAFQCAKAIPPTPLDKP